MGCVLTLINESGSEPADSPVDRDYVIALEKGLAIIEAFGQLRGSATLTNIAEVTGNTKACVRRSLHRLCKLDYAYQEGRQFQLAARTLRLGSAFVASDELMRLAQPILEMTAEQTKESASMAVLDAQDVVFVARATHRRSLSVGLSAGARLPAYASATGRVLLAGHPKDWALFFSQSNATACADGKDFDTSDACDAPDRTGEASGLRLVRPRVGTRTALDCCPDQEPSGTNNCCHQFVRGHHSNGHPRHFGKIIARARGGKAEISALI